MRMRGWGTAALVVAVVLSVALAGCGTREDVDLSPRPDRPPLSVGAKDFTESIVLGQIILQRLEASDIPVVDRTQNASVQDPRDALVSGEIDIYAEYTGNVLVLYHPEVGAELDFGAGKDPGQVYREAARIERRDSGIVWLDPAPADNSWGIAIPHWLASSERLRTLADFARYVEGGGSVKLAGSADFFDRADALPAIEEAYGFSLSEGQKLEMNTLDSAVYQGAASSGAGDANAAMSYATDGTLDSYGLVLLQDPLGSQLPYQPAPVLRTDTYAQYPEIADILAPPFAKLTTETLRYLNAQVVVGGQSPSSVARNWLSASGFLR